MTVTPPARESAVTLLLHRAPDGRLELTLIRRVERGAHPGHVALPGGRREPHDSSLADTAVRETSEELGVPCRAVTVLDALAPVRTITTNQIVYPFVARFDGDPDDFKPQPEEVAAIFQADIAELASESSRDVREMQATTWDSPRRTEVRVVGSHVVWGLTLRILEPVLADLLAGKWAV